MEWYFPQSWRRRKCKSISKRACACSVSQPWSLFATPQTIAHQSPLPMEFSRQEYWSGLSFPSPGDLPHPGIKPTSLHLLHWQGVLYHWAPETQPDKCLSFKLDKKYEFTYISAVGIRRTHHSSHSKWCYNWDLRILLPSVLSTFHLGWRY